MPQTKSPQHKWLLASALVLLLLVVAGAVALRRYMNRKSRIESSPQAETARATQPPWAPARRSAGKDKAWLARHEEFCQIAAKGDIGLLFLGDSIMDDVRQEAKTPGGTALFDERFGKYKPANFGIDRDKTQHLLFRILNGECPPTIHPKVAVMLIGTNNTGEDSPEAIAKGVKACLDAVRERLPATKIILMGEFPRSPHADSDKRAILKKVNTIISTYADGKMVRYVDIYDRFLEPNGDLSDGMRLDDRLHPTLKGYHIWFDAIGPMVDEMMREEATTRPAQ